MGAAEDKGVDLRILMHNLVDAFLDEVVGSRGVGFVVFYEGHPERTCYTRHRDVRMELLDLEVVALTLDGSFGGKHAYVTRFGEVTDNFCCRADDA